MIELVFELCPNEQVKKINDEILLNGLMTNVNYFCKQENHFLIFKMIFPLINKTKIKNLIKIAAENGNNLVLQYLHELKNDIHMPINHYSTKSNSLLIATQNGKYDTMKLLLSLGGKILIFLFIFCEKM